MNFFTRLLFEKFNSSISPETYKHLWHILPSGTLEVVVKLHPTEIDRIYLVCRGTTLEFAFWKKNSEGEYKTSSISRKINLPRPFETYLHPCDLFNIYEKPHTPFNLYYGDVFEFITEDL